MEALVASRTRRGGSGPWKNKGGAEFDVRSLEEALLGPAAGRVEGFEVRKTSNQDKAYRCPYCEGTIQPRSAHTVAFPSGRPGERRHYHTACWGRQARSLGGRRSSV
ncbi:MAG TPA: ATP/GTP-binding protein [Actinomycetota bacterium]|nr:ATP/GTP-binding protein [Actinomycetota bacterium]